MVSMRAAIVLFIVAWFPLCGMAYSIIKGEMDELTAHQWHLQRIRTMSAFVITLAGWRLFSRLKEEFTEEARLLAVVEGQRLYIAPAKGDERCPCATIDEFTSVQLQDTQSYDQLRFQSNLTTYGVGCAKHDAGITQSCLQDCDDCDLRWCDRAWCWVSTDNCQLLNHRSQLFSRVRFYSYATCYEMDYLTGSTRFESLRNTTLKVGFISNSGGWTGAYHTEQKSFVDPLSDWDGPLIGFVKEAARIGNFSIQILPPALFLRQRSNDFFNSTDNFFNDCIYSVALGLLDWCVSEFTVTNVRGTMTPWFVLEEPALVLVTQVKSAKTLYTDAIKTIFQPFTYRTWTFLIFVVIPILGILVIFHEYGRKGSAFPETDDFLEIQSMGRQNLIVQRKIPVYRHVVRAVYTSFLGVLQATNTLPVVTIGGKLHALGVAFFTLVILAVYTANLATILVATNAVSQVKTLQNAIDAGFRFCADRTTISVLQALHKIDERFFVVDPEDLGGDGLPGFQSKRALVFDRLSFFLATKDKRYCHAAITFYQDLQVEQQEGRHCNKTVIISNSLGRAQIGMPLFEGISRELQTLLTNVKNSGEMARQMKLVEPQPVCLSASVEDGSTASLTIRELSGIWFVSFGYATLGLIVTFGKPFCRKCYKKKFHHFNGFNQSGIRVDKLEDVKLKEELEEHPAHPVSKRKMMAEQKSKISNSSTRTLLGKLAHFLEKAEKNTQSNDEKSLDVNSFMGKEWPKELSSSRIRVRVKPTIPSAY